MQDSNNQPEGETSEEDILEMDREEKVSYRKGERSLEQFHRWHQSGRLILDPDWQRNYVWTPKRASLLIESLLIDIPIPLIYLAQNDRDEYEVIDGQQRLNSIFDFFNNKYKLSGLLVHKNFNGHQFKDLPTRLQEKLFDYLLSTVELSVDTPKDLMFEMFERLNTGGVSLNAMEIRNCVYPGSLNDLIKNLVKIPEFTQCMNQKGLSKRMKDREYVLRFLAYYQLKYQNAKKGMKAFLNEFCHTYQNADDQKLQEYENQFKKAIKAAFTIWGDRGFRLNLIEPKNVNAAAYQAIMVSFAEYDLVQLTQSADSIYEEYVDLLLTDEKWLDSVSSHTSDYDRIEYAFETWRGRLREIMKNSEPKDPKRCFSRTLKEEMYKQSNKVCEICGQKIADIYDAALDHDTHYWRGGKTVPDNARLVHRQCNLTRSNNE